MNLEHEKRIVMTLDAGGTNFVFSAIQGNVEIVSPVTFPSHADNLDNSLATIVNGFTEIKKQLPARAVAISFAFPSLAREAYRRLGEVVGDALAILAGTRF